MHLCQGTAPDPMSCLLNVTLRYIYEPSWEKGYIDIPRHTCLKQPHNNGASEIARSDECDLSDALYGERQHINSTAYCATQKWLLERVLQHSKASPGDGRWPRWERTGKLSDTSVLQCTIIGWLPSMKGKLSFSLDGDLVVIVSVCPLWGR